MSRYTSPYDRTLDPTEPKPDNRDCTNCTRCELHPKIEVHKTHFYNCKNVFELDDGKIFINESKIPTLRFMVHLDQTDRGWACDNHKFVLDENI